MAHAPKSAASTGKSENPPAYAAHAPPTATGTSAAASVGTRAASTHALRDPGATAFVLMASFLLRLRTLRVGAPSPRPRLRAGRHGRRPARRASGARAR